MSIEVSCPKCGGSAEMPDRVSGKKVRCNTCGTVFAVPGGQRTVGASSETGLLKLWSDSLDATVVGLAWSSDCRELIVPTANGTLESYDTATGRRTSQYTGSIGPTVRTSMCNRADGGVLGVSLAQGRRSVVTWSCKGTREVQVGVRQELPFRADHVTLSRNGRILAVVRGAEVDLLVKRELLATVSARGPVTFCSFSPDTRKLLIVTAGERADVELFSIPPGFSRKSPFFKAPIQTSPQVVSFIPDSVAKTPFFAFPVDTDAASLWCAIAYTPDSVRWALHIPRQPECTLVSGLVEGGVRELGRCCSGYIEFDASGSQLGVASPSGTIECWSIGKGRRPN